MKKREVLISAKIIEDKILLIRGHKVMLDRDLATLYGVLNKNLNKAVKRNKSRFPSDFMFQLNKKEFTNLKFQFGTSSWGGIRKLPHVFTEHGILMLSSVLNSERAVQVNIQIMRTFNYLRKMLLSHRDLQDRLNALERNYDAKFKNVFDAIKLLIQSDLEINKKLNYEEEKQSNKKFGFHPR